MRIEDSNKLTTIASKSTESIRKNHGEQGCTFMSGATTITGNFYGISIGSVKPNTIVLTTLGTTSYNLNSTVLDVDDNIVDFVVEGEYIPISFTSITTTGSGYLKLWHK